MTSSEWKVVSEVGECFTLW